MKPIAEIRFTLINADLSLARQKLIKEEVNAIFAKRNSQDPAKEYSSICIHNQNDSSHSSLVTGNSRFDVLMSGFNVARKGLGANISAEQALVTDYRGVEVLSAYLPMVVGDSRWAVMAEIDREEIVQGAARERPNFSGALLFVYGLSLWSVWYWRSRQLPGESEQMAMMDFSDAGDGGGLDG